ncbi:hypothetical protein I5F64_07255 [Pseudomonas aeruginosa]|nr:hypothetical protein [Pseudomonas aeruginosa]
MRLTWILGACALGLSCNAQAFPVVIAGGAMLLGGPSTVIALLIAAGVFGYLRFCSGQHGKVKSLALGFAAGLAVLALVLNDQRASQLDANFIDSGSPAERITEIPFREVALDEQAQMPTAMDPAEFIDSLAKRTIRAVRIDPMPEPFFQDFGNGVSAKELGKSPAKLLALIRESSVPVVLIDQYGSSAAAISEALKARLGIEVRFLVGGTKSLHPYGWKHLANEEDPRAILPSQFPKVIAATPGLQIISDTTRDQFEHDGWLHGDMISDLPTFLAGLDNIVATIGDRPILISAAEGYFTGNTWVILTLLRSRGLDPQFILPTEDELLVKPPYYRHFKNAERLFGNSETFSYLERKPRVVFLDFQPAADWATTRERIRGTVHIDMEKVARGQMAEELAKLDPTATYAGLGYDRRSSYHSLLAGEYLSEKGAGWLGINTEPELFSRERLSNPDLYDGWREFSAKARNELGEAGFKAVSLLGDGIKGYLLFSALLALVLTIAFCATPTVAAKGLVAVAALGVFQVSSWTLEEWVRADVPTDWVVAVQLTTGLLSGLCWSARRRNRKRRFTVPEGVRPTELPEKIRLLAEAAEHGFHVLPGVVITPALVNSTGRQLPRWARMKPTIVRSAARSESCEATTIGIYNSLYAAGEHQVWASAAQVIAEIERSGEVGMCFVQPRIQGQTFGVAMFGTEADDHMIICEGGHADQVTAGTAATSRFAVPIWDVNRLDPRDRAVCRVLLRLQRVMGATSIEWARSLSGKLTILQVSTDQLGRIGLKHRISKNTRRFVVAPVAHTGKLEAAVLAACAIKGEQLTVGRYRLVQAKSFIGGLLSLHQDISSAVDYARMSPAIAFPSAAIIEAFETEHRERLAQRTLWLPDLSAETEQLIAAVTHDLGRVRDVYGRFNRLATVAAELRIKARIKGFSRPLSSTVLGAALEEAAADARGDLLERMGCLSLNGFAIQGKSSLDGDDLLGGVIQATDSPMAWLKDECAVQVMYELKRLRPLLAEIEQRGAVDSLLAALDVSVGTDTDSRVAALETVAMQSRPLPLANLLSGHGRDPGRNAFVWGVPAKGICLRLASKDEFQPGDALLIDRAEMSYLPLIARAGALVVREGSALSHLMQHARRLRVPHVVGADIGDQKDSALVFISASGEVCRA